MPRHALTALLGVALVGCAPKAPPDLGMVPDDRIYEGPDHVEVDLLRTTEGGNRIYVQATLPDGEPGLFLVDTGAAISALSEETAKRLGLDIEYGYSYVEGLGGQAPLHRAVVPSLALGEAVVEDVEFAVGVRGVPESALFMPLDGILGNNVWSRFVLEVDYPADVLGLHRPGTVRLPRRAEPMFFDGSHVFVPIEITTAAEDPHVDQIIIQVDTGAGGLLLSGRSGQPFERDYTEGLEPIFGIGASETMPTSEFFQWTRRVPVDKVHLGGRKVDVDLDARWLNYDGGKVVGPRGMRGLVGHELMSDHRVWFDYRGGQFALAKSKRRKRQLNGHQVLLDQDVARHGDDRARYLYRARMLTAVDELDRAVALLEAYLAGADPEAPETGEARVLLANVHRFNGDLDGAWSALEPLSPGVLVDEGEILASVNGLLLEGEVDRAYALAAEAARARPDEWSAHVALADVYLAKDQHHAANSALLLAARLADNPDAHLLRRARVALAAGDRYGAMAHMRKLVQLYPSEGLFLWFYSLLIDSPADATTFRADMEDAVAQLHPNDRPLDFLVAAHHNLGDDDRARTLMREGIERDCSRSPTAPSRDNCIAWYQALAGVDLDASLALVDGALAETGDRSDFLDTKAMVHLAREEYDQATQAALAAARLSPDDVYMLWQAERIQAMARAHRAPRAANETER